jgi:hypothetical protein
VVEAPEDRERRVAAIVPGGKKERRPEKRRRHQTDQEGAVRQIGCGGCEDGGVAQPWHQSREEDTPHMMTVHQVDDAGGHGPPQGV